MAGYNKMETLVFFGGNYKLGSHSRKQFILYGSKIPFWFYMSEKC